MRDRARIRKIKEQHEKEQHAEAQRQRVIEQDQEWELALRRADEDPVGYDRWLEMHELTLEVIDEEEMTSDWSMYDAYHRGGPVPEVVQEAMEAEWAVRMEWLYGDARSERPGPQESPPLNNSPIGESPGPMQYENEAKKTK
jgi:hypothetical protein